MTMLYPQNIENKLKFSRIRNAISEQCLCPIGEEFVADMDFMTDFDAICKACGQTHEMLSILKSGADFPGATFPDLREALSRIRVDGLYLDEKELSALRTTLNLTSETIAFFKKTEEEAFPLLKQLTADINPFPLLSSSIDKIIDKNGKIKDNASPLLSDIRQAIRSQQAQINKRLNTILKQAMADGIVDDEATITLHDGHAVIPVPAAYKRRIDGIVLDESATGKTAFIEPAEIVAINNQLQQLHSDERREIIKILKDTSTNIRPHTLELTDTIITLGFVDFIRAKARFSMSINACMPTIENRQGLYLSQARHPLLLTQLQAQGKKIVPLNVQLESPQSRILIISGPNAGGKSVCLQTVAMLQYMLQCGTLVPTDESSKMGIFNKLFIDIGDDQSIDNDLSTYSSHLTAMKFFVRNADEQTLLLIDEFGTGTEPMLGGAIAEAVLADLNDKKAYGVITTHYTNLKHFASQTNGIANAAMLFDTHNIAPLFTLQIGQPGSSFAFEIARKIGLPESILQSAKEKLGENHLNYDQNLRQIVRDKHYWEQKRQNVKENDKRLAEVLEQYNTMLESIKQERKEIIAKAKEQAQTLLTETNRKIEHVIKEIREAQAEKERTKNLRKELDDTLNALNTTDDNDKNIELKIKKIQQRQNLRNKKQTTTTHQPTTTHDTQQQSDTRLYIGDIVTIDSNPSQTGEIIHLNADEAQIAIGNMTMTIKANRLKRTSRNSTKNAKRKEQIITTTSNIAESVRQKKLTFKPELDVRGLRTDEAIEKVEQFMDQALLTEQNRVTILHGKGTGILRQQIRELLKTLPYVADAHDEHVDFGGAGITVVELK